MSGRTDDDRARDHREFVKALENFVARKRADACREGFTDAEEKEEEKDRDGEPQGEPQGT